jgi:hypothetical protein
MAAINAMQELGRSAEIILILGKQQHIRMVRSKHFIKV